MNHIKMRRLIFFIQINRCCTLTSQIGILSSFASSNILSQSHTVHLLTVRVFGTMTHRNHTRALFAYQKRAHLHSPPRRLLSINFQIYYVKEQIFSNVPNTQHQTIRMLQNSAKHCISSCLRRCVDHHGRSIAHHSLALGKLSKVYENSRFKVRPFFTISMSW